MVLVLLSEVVAEEVSLGGQFSDVLLEVLDDGALLLDNLPELVVLGAKGISLGGDLLEGGGRVG